jgi:hypothetical protein
VGQSVTFTATIVTGNGESLTGTVSILSGGTTIDTGGFTDVQFATASESLAFSVTSLGVGDNQITATYSGDSTHSSSTSPVFVQTVDLPTPEISISFNPNPADLGDSFTATATLSGGSDPTGTITWPAAFGGTTTTLVDGSTSITQVANTAGSLSGTVTYSGDANNSPASVVASLSVITLATTSLTAAATSPIVVGSLSEVTCTVFSNSKVGAISGTISIQNSAGTTVGSATLGSQTESELEVNINQVVVTLPAALPLGTNQLTAVYSGDSVHAGSSIAFDIVVEHPTPQLAVTFTPSSVAFDGSYTATATLTGGDSSAPPTGTITWPAVFGGSTTTVSDLTASISETATVGGTLSGTVTYSGDSNNGPASVVASLSVELSTPTISVSFSPNPAAVGQTVTTTATVTGPGNPTGSVTFASFVAPSSTPVVISGDTATSTLVPNLSPGTVSGTFKYNGDTSNNAVSTTASLTITKNTQTIDFSSISNVTIGAQPFAINATASSGLPVNFTSSTPSICTVSGSTVTVIASGVGTITASQAGNADFSAATPVSQSFTVEKNSPRVAVVLTPNPVVFGNTYTGKATVSGGSNPTGTVTWPSVFGGSTTTLAGGIATLAAQSPTGVGTFTGEVIYNGDSNNASAEVSASLVVSAKSQVIKFNAIPSPVNLTVTSITLVATGGGSGNPVVFSIVSGPGTISGDTLTITGPGTIVIAANQAGNADFLAAATVTQSVTAQGAIPTVTQLFASNDSIIEGTSVTFSALVSTGGHAPTGTVSFVSNGSSIGSSTISTDTTTNLLSFSNQFGQGDWSQQATAGTGAPVLTSDNQFDPFGTNTASTLVFPTVLPGGVSFLQNATLITPAPGSIYTMSVWLRANSDSVVSLQMTESNGNNSFVLGVNVTPTWQRFSLTSGAFDGTAELFWRILDTNPPATTVFIFGAQLELASSAGPYVATGASSAAGSGGTASLTTSALPIGEDAVVATYQGDLSDQTSSSPAVNILVSAVNSPVFSQGGALLLISPFSATVTVAGTTWHAFPPNPSDTIVDAVHSYLNETILLTSAGELLQMIPDSPPVDTDNAQASIVLSNITSQTFTNLDATPPYNGLRVFTLFGPDGVLMLQVNDAFTVMSTLALGENNTGLFGSNNVQWVALSNVESLKTGEILVGTKDSDGNSFETEFSLVTKTVVATFDAANLGNSNLITTGDILFEATDPYSGFPLSPVLASTGTGVGSVSLSWTQTRPDLVNGFIINVTLNGGLVKAVNIASGATTSATVSGLPTGNTYTISIVAVSADGTSAPSNVLSVSL